ncbi:helix-turn-helix transcriptional regulator [Cellulomonas endophytica]|uniref:helix-turn-helix transcriptional regulator n=1 Tax=Cellulomonas endophytica TaxID=2494735 RepID=UPI0010123267|nr:WYL domain-containing protein [Cellulomonas endophytica]
MATTSARALRLLSTLAGGRVWPAADLAQRLEVSARTLRRDVDTLRGLGYTVQPVKGVGGGYRLVGGARLPPLVLDEEQVVAIAVSLQAAPRVLAGLDGAAASALASVRQVMPERLRLESDALVVTALPNLWEFPADLIDAGVVRAVGAAVRRRHLLRVVVDGGDGGADGAGEAVLLEPYAVVVWAARWYLVAADPAGSSDGRWRVLRLDRLTVRAPTGTPFAPRPLPPGGIATLVQETPDRGDVLASWPCQGSAELAVPAPLAARFAPGGAVVEHVTEGVCRLRMGAWSWTGLAGLYLTFAAELRAVEPDELRAALRGIRERVDRSEAATADDAGRVDDRRGP